MCLQIKIWLLTLCLFFAVSGRANSEGGGHGDSAGQGAGHGEAAKDDGKHGKDKKNPEWMDLSNSLLAVKTKIRMKEELIQKLIEEKSKAKNPDDAAKIVKQMVFEHKELQKTIADYEEKRNLLQYRYPEAGILKERNYERIEGKSLESMEKKWNLEGKIKATVKNIKSKYRAESKSPAETKESVKPKPQESNPLAEPIIISK